VKTAAPPLDLAPLSQKDLLCTSALTTADIERLFTTAAALKAGRDLHTDLLRNKRLAMIFEKDSLRTRFTFDIGMQDLGGNAVFMDHRDARLGSRESVKDVAKNLERWVDCIVARTYKHKALEELAANARIPVVNGLSDFVHPCQALADFFTLVEKWGSVRGRTIVYVGDGNNTCHALIHTAVKLGAHIRVCSPEGYEPNARVVNEAMRTANATGSEVTILDDPDAAVEGADAVYTDVWASMGQEDEIEERNGIFAAYQVDEDLMARARGGALFMHCLPAHRGQEVTQEVMDGPQSVVYDIAENRLHVQKAILALLIRRTC
jgi:ornithine carbamoyltransferase